MRFGDGEIERIARELIKQHGAGAPIAAVERLNERIDCGDWGGRDIWARVVHAVHHLQSGKAPVIRPDMPFPPEQPAAPH